VKAKVIQMDLLLVLMGACHDHFKSIHTVSLRMVFIWVSTSEEKFPVPIAQEAVWPSKLVWTQSGGKTLLPATGIGRSVCSQTLYWLSYPSSFHLNYAMRNTISLAANGLSSFTFNTFLIQTVIFQIPLLLRTDTLYWDVIWTQQQPWYRNSECSLFGVSRCTSPLI
jgi:hypothetical protein